MNIKSLAALTLAASSVPLASAGLIAYGLCQTGEVPPTGWILYSQSLVALVPSARLQHACSCMLRSSWFHLRGDHSWGTPCHLGV
ncbi:hypothetical protein J3R83DRAFT_2525 [Lanmaoa asiatica]|nr:hypothetical protein J3R83DRAFT_2525 [Lanmaoa asiatica]